MKNEEPAGGPGTKQYDEGTVRLKKWIKWLTPSDDECGENIARQP